MFVLHYLFKDEQTFNNLADNLNKVLKPGGYFLCTLFDGNLIHKKFKDNKIDSYYFDNSQSRKFFEIKKLYNESNINDFGLKLDVHISSFMNPDTYQTEYLVTKDFLIKKLKEKCNLELVETELFENIFNSHEKFFNSIPKVESNKNTKSYFTKVKEIYDLSDNLNKASFEMSRLNRYYIFQKPTNSNVDITKSSKSKVSKINLDIVNNNTKKIKKVTKGKKGKKSKKN